MVEFLVKLLLVARSKLKSRARLEAENIVLRQLRNIDRLIFVWRATPPAEIADVVFDEGIRQGKLYIIPHKQTGQYIRSRFEGIMQDV